MDNDIRSKDILKEFVTIFISSNTRELIQKKKDVFLILEFMKSINIDAKVIGNIGEKTQDDNIKKICSLYSHYSNSGLFQEKIEMYEWYIERNDDIKNSVPAETLIEYRKDRNKQKKRTVSLYEFLIDAYIIDHGYNQLDYNMFETIGHDQRISNERAFKLFLEIYKISNQWPIVEKIADQYAKCQENKIKKPEKILRKTNELVFANWLNAIEAINHIENSSKNEEDVNDLLILFRKAMKKEDERDITEFCKMFI